MINVLYVDDERAILDVTKEILELMGDLSIITEESPMRALKLDLSDIDVILSDYEMPAMNGLEFLQGLRARGIELPFIMFTGRGREDVAIEALNAGADAYVQKGIDTDAQYSQLVHSIQRAVERHRSKTMVQDERNLLFRILDTIPAFSFIRSKDNHYIYVNKVFRDTFGDPEGMTCHEFMRSSSIPCEDCREVEVQETGVPFSRQMEFKGRVYMVDSFPFSSNMGGEGTMTFAIDITEEERSIRDMQDVNDLLRFTHDVNTVILGKDDVNDILTSVSEILHDSEIIEDATLVWRDGEGSDRSAPLDDIPSGDDAEALIRIPFIVDDLTDGELVVRSLRPGCNVDTVGGMLRGLMKDVSNRLGTIRLLDAESRAKSLLTESELRFKRLFDLSNDMIYLHEYGPGSMPGRIIEVNAKACEVMGYTREEFLSMDVVDLNDPEYEMPIDALSQRLEDKRNALFEWRHVKKDGGSIPVEISLNRSIMNGEHVALAVVRDISDRKRYETVLKNMEWMLSECSEGDVHWSLIDDEGSIDEIRSSVSLGSLESMIDDVIRMLGTKVLLCDSNGVPFMIASESIYCLEIQRSDVECDSICWGPEISRALNGLEVTEGETLCGFKVITIPIIIDDEAIGAVCAMYGDPPSGRDLADVAERFHIDEGSLRSASSRHLSRPPFITDLAKRRLVTISETISNMIRKTRLENDLEKQRTLLEERIEIVSDGLWDWDISKNELYSSPRYNEMLGYDVSKVGDPYEWGEFIHPDDRAEAAQALNDAFDRGRDSFNSEMRVRKSDGTYKWLMADAKVLRRDDDGMPVRIIGMHKDITPIKEREHRLMINQFSVD